LKEFAQDRFAQDKVSALIGLPVSLLDYITPNNQLPASTDRKAVVSLELELGLK
jgi:hypothetical protein